MHFYLKKSEFFDPKKFDEIIVILKPSKTRLRRILSDTDCVIFESVLVGKIHKSLTVKKDELEPQAFYRLNKQLNFDEELHKKNELSFFIESSFFVDKSYYNLPTYSDIPSSLIPDFTGKQIFKVYKR